MTKRYQQSSYELIAATVGYKGTECLLWTRSRNNFGYGQLGHKGKIWKAHRLMCILEHGKPPSHKHYAAHSCGNGHLGCYNPRHLSWKTPSENMQDASRHGAVRKPGGGRTKLTAANVAEIKRLRRSQTLAELGLKFGTRTENIRKILSGETWSKPWGRPSKKFTPEERRKVIKRAKTMRNSGSTLDAIAKTVGVSRAQVRLYLKKA